MLTAKEQQEEQLRELQRRYQAIGAELSLLSLFN